MRTLVESLKRLYISGRVSKEQLTERVDKGIITTAELNYIIGYVETKSDGITAEDNTDE
jgi:hypothetical protein